MQDPEPNGPQPGWQPTTSTVGGAAIGAAFAQIILALSDQCFHASIGAATASAITTLCVAAAGYFFKDGGRK